MLSSLKEQVKLDVVGVEVITPASLKLFNLLFPYIIIHPQQKTYEIFQNRRF